MRRVVIFLFITTFLIIQESFAYNSYSFRKVDIKKGLTNNEIRCIFKDSKGFVWFGTPSGLNRYDGAGIIAYCQSFSPDQKGSFNNDVWQIQESFDHKLWLETAYSYSIYDLETEQFEENVTDLYVKYSGVTDFSKLFIDSKKNFWFILWDDVRLYNVETGELNIFQQGGSQGLSRGLILDIKEGDGCYWFLFDNGVIECMDAETHLITKKVNSLRSFLNQERKERMRLFVDSSGDVWVYRISVDLGIACYDIKEENWQIYSSKTPEYYISQNIVMSLEEDENGKIWVGTDHGGISIIDKEKKQTTVLRYNEKNPSCISENTINALYRDDIGIMWLGTYKAGVCYYHNNLYKFHASTEKEGLSFVDINCFEEDEKGNIWIGTNGGGLIYYDRENEEFITHKHQPGNSNSPAGNVIVSLELDQQKRLWIGYYLSGMDCYDGTTYTHYRADSEGHSTLTDNNIWQLLLDSKNQLWIGTLRGGVIVIDPNTGKQLNRFVTDGSVYSIMEKKNGEILIGSQRGLFVYNSVANKLILYDKEILGKEQLYRSDINALYEDERRLLWIGTRNGLFIYNHSLKGLSYIDVVGGLPANLIQSIKVDDQQNVWLATNNGLARISAQEDANEETGYSYSIVKYNPNDGLQGEQYNFNSALQTSKSELVFGGLYGFDLFLPSSISNSINNAHVVLTDFSIYNKRIRPGMTYDNRVLLEKSIAQTKEITLKHSDNHFTIAFTALDYINEQKIKYYYRLKGFNDEWLEANRTYKRATFTNLDPGMYVFELKAVNEEKIDADYEPITLDIRITPPFFKSIWGYLLYLLIFIAFLAAYRSYIIKRVKSKE